MNNVLTPSIGSNQYLKKFGIAKKHKLQLRINRKIKVKFAVITILFFSLYLNYYLLKTNYTLNCNVTLDGIVQAQAGHLMNNAKCNSINQDWVEARTYEAAQRSGNVAY